MVQSAPTEFSPAVFARYTQSSPFTVSKAFNHILTELHNYREYFSEKDIAILEKQSRKKQSSIIASVKQQARIFKNACQRIENAGLSAPETKMEAMIEAYEKSELATTDSSTTQYNKTLVKLSDEGRNTIENTIIPQIIPQGSSTHIDWRSLAENDFAALEHLFNLSCDGFKTFDETQTLELMPKITQGISPASNGDGLSYEMKQYQVKK